jgi:hypothetical protein
MSSKNKVKATAKNIEEELLNLKPDNSEKVVHNSDGSELIPSEVPVELPNQDNLVAGYTKDDEGIINNYAVEPAMTAATYPTSKQQLRYVFWGVGAIVFVSVILLIAFSIS